jgi:hypothetical protein
MNNFHVKRMTLAILAIFLCLNCIFATDIVESNSICDVYGVRLTLGSYFTYKGENDNFSE